MLAFLVPLLSFLLLLSCPFPLKPLPRWANELRLVFFLFFQELACLGFHWLSNFFLFFQELACLGFHWLSNSLRNIIRICTRKRRAPKSDLPDLAIDCILEKLSPAELCNTASSCVFLRAMCAGDHLWERHMKNKWGRVLGPVACREWQELSASWMTISDRKSKVRVGSASFMSWYSALEGGRIWFPAQVYNRENGHDGFTLSCYDAELSYDRQADTFYARYPLHGRWPRSIENGVKWDRIRSSPVDTRADELHVSDCLNDLRAGDHIEIQWRRNKEFPYGWWYGAVGHLESCDGIEHSCHCNESDKITLEFNQYSPGSRWRHITINRMDHHEQGNEADGFYGGIRKLRQDEISAWRKFWPTKVLE